MVSFAQPSPKKRFLVATETGILHRLHKEAPEKRFEAVSEKAICQYMKMITLEKLRDSLRDWKHVVTVARGLAAARAGRDRPDGRDHVRPLSESERRFLESPFVGTVTDLRPDGSPHSTVVWVDVDDDGVSFNTAWPRAKPRYIASDPRVSLTVVDPDGPVPLDLDQRDGELVEDGANDQIDRLAKKYVDRDTYPWHKPEERRVSVRIAPTRIESRGLD